MKSTDNMRNGNSTENNLLDDCVIEIEPEAKEHVLDKARHRYINAFTVHGVEHIAKGSKPEKVLWTIKLCGLFTVAIYFSLNLFVAYLRHDVDTKLSIEKKKSMALPTILICNNHFDDLSYNNCSSKLSKSYNPAVCEKLQQPYPNFLKVILEGAETTHPDIEGSCTDKYNAIHNITKFSPTEGQPTHIHGRVSCESQLMGQCVSLNGDGKFHQDINVDKMIYEQDINASMLPLNVYLKSPGHVERFPLDHREVIDRFGAYQFSLKKTTITRKPEPYSKPPCIEPDSDEGKERNMFIGDYTTEKCTSTCWAKAELTYCRSIMNIERVLVRDQKSLLEQTEDQKSYEIDKCMEDYENETTMFYNKCIENCYSSCFEEIYDIRLRYIFFQEQRISLEFYFKELQETKIVEVPSYEMWTLLANVGGTLGLMTGMSAVSLIEFCLWFVLYCVHLMRQLLQKLK